jgi:hypothetical protein
MALWHHQLQAKQINLWGTNHGQNDGSYLKSPLWSLTAPAFAAKHLQTWSQLNFMFILQSPWWKSQKDDILAWASLSLHTHTSVRLSHNGKPLNSLELGCGQTLVHHHRPWLTPEKVSLLLTLLTKWGNWGRERTWTMNHKTNKRAGDRWHAWYQPCCLAVKQCCSLWAK